MKTYGSGRGFAGHKQTTKSAIIQDSMLRGADGRMRKKARYPVRMFFAQRVRLPAQLYRGEATFPRTQNMTCTQLGHANKELSLAFLRRLEGGDDEAKLWQWQFIDLQALRAGMKKFLERFMGQPPQYETEWSDWLRDNGFDVMSQEEYLEDRDARLN